MTEIQEKLFSMQDEKYRDFQGSIVPTVDSSTIIGVRVPNIRAYAKELWKSQEKNDKTVESFLSTLPHEYYEENLLHGFLLEFIKDFDQAVRAEDAFLPYVDNWAVSDTTHPKVFKKHTQELLPWIKKWISSKGVFQIRYGVDCLMTWYLDEAFEAEQMKLVWEIQSSEYYVNMMRAWYFATALAKQWDAAVKVIEDNRMDVWTHNKTIQKAVESFRVSPEHKEYLKTLKRK